MSQATKRKHVAREVLEEFVTPNENQQIVKLIAGRGNNLHEVETAFGKTFLVSMPTKFRKHVWIKRGDFVVIEPIDEGDKVKAEIVNILYKHHIRSLKQDGLWPKQFDDKSSSKHSLTTQESNLGSQSESSDDNTSESDNNDKDLFVNTNRPNVANDSTDCSSSSDSEIDEEK